MSNNKYLEKTFNVAAVRVSTSNQDCDRQKETLLNLGNNLGIKYDLWIEDKGQKRGCIGRNSFKKLEELSLLYPDGFNLWYSDVSRLGTYELWEKQKNEFFLPNKISIFTPNMLWDICAPETITERVMTTCLFAIATDELESLCKRIKGKHEVMMKMGLYATGNIPWLCDVRREDLNGNHILTFREMISKNKAKKFNQKVRYIIINSDGEIKKQNPPKHDKTKNIQRLILTGDKERIEIIWYIYNWCQKQKKLGIGYTWNQLAVELSSKFDDKYGCGWTTDRVRDLILNPTCIGLPLIGKSINPDSPTIFFRNKEKADGFERNVMCRLEKSEGNNAAPESNYVQPDKPLFNLLPVKEWRELRDDILSLKTGQVENIKKINEVRKNKGLRKLCRPKHLLKKTNWLNAFIWDDVHNCQFSSTGKQICCKIKSENERYKLKQDSTCRRFYFKMLDLMIKDYFRLPFWQNYHLNDYKTETFLLMQSLINKFIKTKDKEKYDFEKLYLLALEKENFFILKEIKKLDDQLCDIYKFIGRDELPTLKKQALDLELKKTQLEKSVKLNLLPLYQVEMKKKYLIEESLLRIKTNTATDLDFQLIMKTFNVKLHINCENKEKYISIYSSVVDAIMEISEVDYNKFYKARFYPWAKGKEFDYLAGKFYDGSMKTKKKNLCPSSIARFNSRKKRMK